MMFCLQCGNKYEDECTHPELEPFDWKANLPAMIENGKQWAADHPPRPRKPRGPRQKKLKAVECVAAPKPLGLAGRIAKRIREMF
jgi:hypothetical protein